MAANEQSPEQRELSLVGKVEMRIALADTDAKLEASLKTYLAPLLLKLASEHQAVRNKVISICQHINTRVKPESIQLPVAALIKQFKDQESSLIRHFDLLYIQQGLDRLRASEKSTLLPVIISGIAKSEGHGPTIFNLLLRLLETFQLPPRGDKADVELRTKYEVSDQDAAYVAAWLGKFLLFTPQKTTSQTCAGLSPEEYAFFTVQGKPGVWDPAQGGMNLLRTKVLAAKLLASGLFKDEERFLPALFASADTASTISDVGDDMMKRTLPATDLEDEKLIHDLFTLYFGEGQAPRVRPPLRVKILGLLGKSTKSTTFANKIMSLVEDGVAPPETDGEDTAMSGMPSTNRPNNIGREATKLRSAVFAYVNFVARYGGQETLHAIAPRVVSRLRDFIENQGWPKVGGTEDLVSRGYAYEVIGLLAKAGPRELLVESEGTNFDLLRYLFSSLAQDTSGSAIIVSIEEALSTVLSATANLELNESEQSVLENLFIEEMEMSSDLEGNKRLRSTRYTTVRFANRCLPFSSVKARWVDILGIGARGERMELREEAERGLSPYWYCMLNGSSAISGGESVGFPEFNSVVEEFFTGRTIDSDEEAMAVARNANKLRKHCFAHMTAFARRIIFNEALTSAGNPPNMDHEWERRLDAAAESDDKARRAIKAHMVSVEQKQPQALAILECALFEGVAADPSAPQDHLVEFLSLASNDLVRKLAPAVDQLMPSILSNHHNARMAAAHAYAIIATHPAANTAEVHSQVMQLLEKAQGWEIAIGAQANQVHGALVTLGFFFGRTCYRNPTDFEKNDLYQKFLPLLMKIVSSAKDALIKEASFIALGQLCMFGAFVPETESVKQAIDKIYEVAKTGNEQATLCLGQMSMVLDEASQGEEGDNLTYVIEQLHKLHEVRQAEVHFGVGEAFSYVASGWKSSALAAKLDIEGPMPSGPKRSATLEKLADRFIADCAQTKPSLKKAAAMWLLCLVQFCGEEQEIQSRLGPIQVAFKRCLTDRDELVQETASRGLGLVYEKGDRSLKDDLVRDLVSSFSSDKPTGLAGTVSADTQLFEPGALPTGDGSVSTYKDIMSLASEVGDSSLVYRFMSMASSNAIWSSRAAFGRFGLSNVLSDSSVDGYLADNPKLYPKLFRYRFDPNQGVQRSMNDIWNALVKDSSATIDKHFDAIIEDLLTSVLGKEWRTRQASCAAIADLVQGRPMEKYEPYLERIWNSCFKVLDDIKDSVRKAAASLARTLTGILTRALEADHSSTKTAASMLKHVLPFLLSPSGMESSAQEVQNFAVRTLLEIVKKSNGKTLRPFIPELVERLIGLLSSLEPEAVNYIHLNASKYNLTEQKIDDMRLSSVRSSPIMEAVERCLDLVDDETMQELQPRLANAMKSAVGLPSKVGSSRILVSLSTRRMAIFKPVADDFLKLIEKLVLDRNETVASSYAAAAGYVARHASDKQLLRMVAFAKGLYFHSEHDRERRSLTAAELVLAFAKQASDRFNSLAASILPFVFVGKHDSHAAVKDQFQNTWEEAVGGSRAVLLYLKEILELSSTHLDSAQWTLKHTAARTVADSVMAVSASEAQISADAAKLLWPSLEKALGGKTWEGKEVVLAAFVKFVQNAKSAYGEKDSAVAAAIVKIAVREAKRQNAAYRPHAVKALAQVAAARRDIDMHETVMAIVTPLLDEDVESDPMDVDKDGSKASGAADTRDSTMAAAIEAIFASVNPEAAKSKEELRRNIATSLAETRRLRNPNIALQRAVYKGIAALFESLTKSKSDADGSIAAAGDGSSVVKDLKEHLFRADAGSEAVRLLRADAIAAVVGSDAALAAELRPAILSLAKEDPSTLVRAKLAGAADAAAAGAGASTS